MNWINGISLFGAHHYCFILDRHGGLNKGFCGTPLGVRGVLGALSGDMI